jgi:hypothetical protein
MTEVGLCIIHHWGGVGDTYAREAHVSKVKICTPDSNGRGLRGDSPGK